MGSIGRGVMTALSSIRVRVTLWPGLMPSFLLISTGMTIWPFEEVLTTLMVLPPEIVKLERSITSEKRFVK
jgi:hypothetical protein